jgi:V/A-type H+-transporting ATPase subunit E
LLSEAKRMLLDELISFRERDDYQLILVGLLLEAEEALPGGGPLKFRLSGADAFMGSEVAKGASRLRPQVVVRFDPDPAPIVGGLWLATEDGRRQVSVDWQTKVNELADVLASRIMPLL